MKKVMLILIILIISTISIEWNKISDRFNKNYDLIDEWIEELQCPFIFNWVNNTDS